MICIKCGNRAESKKCTNCGFDLNNNSFYTLFPLGSENLSTINDGISLESYNANKSGDDEDKNIYSQSSNPDADVVESDISKETLEHNSKERIKFNSLVLDEALRADRSIKRSYNFNYKIIPIILYLLGEAACIGAVFYYNIFTRGMDESATSFIVLQVMTVVHALIGTILALCAKSKWISYSASAISVCVAIASFIYAMTDLKGFGTKVLGFFFFGIIEYAVAWISWLFTKLTDRGMRN